MINIKQIMIGFSITMVLFLGYQFKSLAYSSAPKEKEIVKAPPVVVLVKDTAKITQPVKVPYMDLKFKDVSKLKSGHGTKSVVFNSSMSNLYGLNLEGMSVYEYSQAQKKVSRIFKFKPTPGKGWDYEANVEINSFEEKPVEAYISNHDSIIWVSLHNAGGIVPIPLYEDVSAWNKKRDKTDKLIWLCDSKGQIQDSLYVPLIKTGATPKVIQGTPNDVHLLVSNWHSYTISVLELSATYPFAKVIKQIPVTAIPRGIAVDPINNKCYVAIMGGNSLSVIDDSTWSITGSLTVGTNPRHVVRDDNGKLFVSFNSTAKLGAFDPVSGKELFAIQTPPQPRSISLSKNGKFVFVTSYSGDKIAIYKVADNSFQSVGEWECKGSPVGIDVFENDNTIEVWVCAYSGGQLSVYSFDKVF